MKLEHSHEKHRKTRSYGGQIGQSNQSKGNINMSPADFVQITNHDYQQQNNYRQHDNIRNMAYVNQVSLKGSTGRKGSVPQNYKQQKGLPNDSQGQHEKAMKIPSSNVYLNQNFGKNGKTNSNQQFNQSQMLQKNDQLNNKNANKMIKSHAKYFSQQNSPIQNKNKSQQYQNQQNESILYSGAGVINMEQAKMANPNKFMQIQNTAGNHHQFHAASHQVSVEEQLYTQQNNQFQTVLPSGIGTSSSHHLRQGKNASQLSHQSHGSQSNMGKGGGQSQSQVQYYQNIGQKQNIPVKQQQQMQQQLQQQMQQQQQWSSNMVGGQQQQHHLKGSKSGGHNHSTDNYETTLQRQQNNGQSQSANRNSLESQQHMMSNKPSQEHVKNYHSINQAPIISVVAGNQSVGNNNTLQSNISQNQQNFLSNQSSMQNSQKLNHKKMVKQKYDDTFLNGPINENTEEQLIDTDDFQMSKQVNQNITQKRQVNSHSQMIGGSNYRDTYQMQLLGGSQGVIVGNNNLMNNTQQQQYLALQQLQRASTSIGGQNNNKQALEKSQEFLQKSAAQLSFLNSKGATGMKEAQMNSAQQVGQMKSLKKQNKTPTRSMSQQKNKHGGQASNDYLMQNSMSNSLEQKQKNQNKYMNGRFESDQMNVQPQIIHHNHKQSSSPEPQSQGVTKGNKGQKGQNNVALNDRKMVIGRTATPNFLKKPSPTNFIATQNQANTINFNQNSKQFTNMQSYYQQESGNFTSKKTSTGPGMSGGVGGNHSQVNSASNLGMGNTNPQTAKQLQMQTLNLNRQRHCNSTMQQQTQMMMPLLNNNNSQQHMGNMGNLGIVGIGEITGLSGQSSSILNQSQIEQMNSLTTNSMSLFENQAKIINSNNNMTFDKTKHQNMLSSQKATPNIKQQSVKIGGNNFFKQGNIHPNDCQIQIQELNLPQKRRSGTGGSQINKSQAVSANMGHAYQEKNKHGEFGLGSSKKDDPLTFSMKKQKFHQRAETQLKNHQNQYELLGGHPGQLNSHLNGSASSQLSSSGLQGGSFLALPREYQYQQNQQQQHSRPQSIGGKRGDGINTINNKRVNNNEFKNVNSKSQKTQTSRLVNSDSQGRYRIQAINILNGQTQRKDVQQNAISTDRLAHQNQVNKGLIQTNQQNINYGGNTGLSNKNSVSSNNSKNGHKLSTLQHNNNYPYQSSTTKSGKNLNQNQKLSNMALAQIFQQKGITYKGYSKIVIQGDSSKKKYKVANNGVVIHQKRAGQKGALTTSANSAANTTQISPRIMQNNGIMQGNKNLNSSRRKPLTAQMVAGSFGVSAVGGQGSTTVNSGVHQQNVLGVKKNSSGKTIRQNSNQRSTKHKNLGTMGSIHDNRGIQINHYLEQNSENLLQDSQRLYENQVQATEVAYFDQTQMKELEPSKLNNYNQINQNYKLSQGGMQNIYHNSNSNSMYDNPSLSAMTSQERIQFQKQNDVGQQLSYTLNQQKLHKFQEAAQEGHVHMDQQMKHQNSQEKNSDFLQISQKYSNQILDGGTGSNPNLLNNRSDDQNNQYMVQNLSQSNSGNVQLGNQYKPIQNIQSLQGSGMMAKHGGMHQNHQMQAAKKVQKQDFYTQSHPIKSNKLNMQAQANEQANQHSNSLGQIQKITTQKTQVIQNNNSGQISQVSQLSQPTHVLVQNDKHVKSSKSQISGMPQIMGQMTSGGQTNLQQQKIQKKSDAMLKNIHGGANLNSGNNIAKNKSQLKQTLKNSDQKMKVYNQHHQDNHQQDDQLEFLDHQAIQNIDRRASNTDQYIFKDQIEYQDFTNNDMTPEDYDRLYAKEGIKFDQNDHFKREKGGKVTYQSIHVDGPLITEEDEQEIRQVASDINEKAFYGKILRTKQIIDTNHDVKDQHFKNLSPRSQEIAYVMKFINQSFKQHGVPPETDLQFYRIGKMLGRGAFGKVNLAMHKLVRKLVALKSLNKECLTDEVQKQKLMKEVNLLLKLRHDHVVKIYETIETKKHIIIVMELCAGGDLLNYVRKRRRLKEPFAKKIFRQIIDGLKFIHSKFIAHRDIKLDNILLDGKGSVKIADFGVSKQVSAGVKMREQCGTPAYIAPELLKNKNGYSFNVDLWSAGVVLFAMLYGTVPFKAASMEELHSLILRGIYTLKDDISEDARNMLRGLLEINPHKRLTIEQIYEHPWLKDYDEGLQLFNDQEREMIKKEYTYNDPSRYNRNENEEPIDCFTEHNIDSVYNTMKNVSEKSIILAPFNSTQSEELEVFIRKIQPMMQDKNVVLRLSRLCREIDRQYEFNNNGQLDNGVYHKQIINSDESGSDDEKDGKGKKDKTKGKSKEKKNDDGKDSDDDEDDEAKFQIMQCSKSQGLEFLTEDYVDPKETKKEAFINSLINNMAEEERKLIEESFGTNKDLNIDEDKIQKLVHFGYPHDYVLQSLQENQPNYLTAGYYLLEMDQNYC